MIGLMESGAPEDVVVPMFLTLWTGGVVGARIWWLRRKGKSSESDGVRNGLTTGEMTAQRLELMEQRIYELEERLELSERMLLQVTERQRLKAGVAEQPQ
jgi:hypothetical protein